MITEKSKILKDLENLKKVRNVIENSENILSNNFKFLEKAQDFNSALPSIQETSSFFTEGALSAAPTFHCSETLIGAGKCGSSVIPGNIEALPGMNDFVVDGDLGTDHEFQNLLKTCLEESNIFQFPPIDPDPFAFPQPSGSFAPLQNLGPVYTTLENFKSTSLATVSGTVIPPGPENTGHPLSSTSGAGPSVQQPRVIKKEIGSKLWECFELETIPEESRRIMGLLYENDLVTNQVNYYLREPGTKQENRWISLEECFKKNFVEWVRPKSCVPKYFLVPPSLPIVFLTGLWSIIKERVKIAGQKKRKKH